MKFDWKRIVAPCLLFAVILLGGIAIQAAYRYAAMYFIPTPLILLQLGVGFAIALLACWETLTERAYAGRKKADIGFIIVASVMVLYVLAGFYQLSIGVLAPIVLFFCLFHVVYVPTPGESKYPGWRLLWSLVLLGAYIAVHYLSIPITRYISMTFMGWLHLLWVTGYSIAFAFLLSWDVIKEWKRNTKLYIHWGYLILAAALSIVFLVNWWNIIGYNYMLSIYLIFMGFSILHIFRKGPDIAPAPVASKV